MKIKLADRYQLIKLDNEQVFLVDDEILELENCSLIQIETLEKLANGCFSRDELLQTYPNEGIDELLNELEYNDIIRRVRNTDYEGTIVQNQLGYLEDFGDDVENYQNRLNKSCVAILGVGGVGSIVLQHLVGAGIRSFILIDPDIVQIDNFNRQFIYKNSDLGKKKVEVSKEYVNKIDSSITINIHPIMIDSNESLTILDEYHIDFFINAADQPQLLPNWVNDYCIKRSIPWISAGVSRNIGYWGPLIVPERTICMNCYITYENNEMDEWELNLRKIVNPTIKTSFGPTNTIISALVAKDVITYLATKQSVPSLGRRCVFNFNSLQTITENNIPEGGCSCWKKHILENFMEPKIFR